MISRRPSADSSHRQRRLALLLTVGLAAATCALALAACGSSGKSSRTGASVNARVRGVHARTWGAELPGLDQYSRRARPVTRGQISRANVPQQAPAGRWPARGDTREHEAEDAAPRAVHARAWRPQLPRPEHPQPRPVHDRTATRLQHRRPCVQTSGRDMRGRMTSASLTSATAKRPTRLTLTRVPARSFRTNPDPQTQRDEAGAAARSEPGAGDIPSCRCTTSWRVNERRGLRGREGSRGRSPNSGRAPAVSRPADRALRGRRGRPRDARRGIKAGHGDLITRGHDAGARAWRPEIKASASLDFDSGDRRYSLCLCEAVG
jgi:hypothetical protein